MGPFPTDLHLDRFQHATPNPWATLLGALLCFPAGWTTAGIVLLLGLCVCQVADKDLVCVDLAKPE